MYDIKSLHRLKHLRSTVHGSMQAFWDLDKGLVGSGAIPRKYKELMTVAVALATQCPYCIHLHGDAARDVGATDEEIAETVVLAAALRAGAAVSHGTRALVERTVTLYRPRSPLARNKEYPTGDTRMKPSVSSDLGSRF